QRVFMAACAAPGCRTMAAAARMKHLRRAIFIWLLPNAFAQLLYCRILAAPGKARLWQVGRFECSGLHFHIATTRPLGAQRTAGCVRALPVSKELRRAPDNKLVAW